MKKYKELAGVNQKYVDELRERARALTKLRHELEQETMNLEPQNWRAASFTEIAEEEADLIQAIREFEIDIEAEYAEVPFAKSRHQGIAAFWREVGGKIHL